MEKRPDVDRVPPRETRTRGPDVNQDQRYETD